MFVGQLAEGAHPYPFVTHDGWNYLQSASVLYEFTASVHILGVHAPVAVVLQGPSAAVNLPHCSVVPAKPEQVIG